MAATALVATSVKVTGVESANSLASQIYELAVRFNAAAPADFVSGHKDSVVGWDAVPTTGGAEAGIILKAVSKALDVSIGTTEELDFTLPEGEGCFIPGIAGTPKVKYSNEAGTYDYVIFGAAA